VSEGTATRPRGTRSDAPRRRSDRAIRNDELITSAVVDAIAERGVDHVVARDVAARAGLTTGALYTRFDSVGDLLAEAWAARCGPALREVVALTRAVVDGGASAASLVPFEQPSQSLLAATELCIAAGRVAELADVVPRDLRRWIRADDLAGGAREVGTLAYLLGTVVYGTIDPLVRADVTTIVQWLFDGRAAEPSGPAPEPVLPVPLEFTGDDPVRNLLLGAAVQVVARSGIQHATLKRIARVAGYAPSFVYSRYDSRDALYADVVMAVSESVPAAHLRRPSPFSSPTTMAAHLAGWVHPEARVRRRVALECSLASAHAPGLATAVGALELGVDRSSVEGLGPVDDPAREALRVFVRGARPVVHGLCLLEDSTGLLHGMDWRVLGDAVTAGIVQSLGSDRTPMAADHHR